MLQTTWREFRGVAVLLAVAMVSGGCSRGPKLAPVNGIVTWNGQPVPYAYVVYQPIEPKGAYGAAYTDEQGRYELAYTRSKKGALVGQHEVTVRTSSIDEIQVEDKATGLMITPKLPPGYKPKLEVKFQRSVEARSNEIHLELTSGESLASGNSRRQ